jgi:RNA polymerase sigma factor (sigma-70 family)
LSVTVLLRRAGEGDGDAWEALMRRFGRLVRAVVRRHRLQEADAHEAEQRTWLRLLEQHRSVRDPEHLGSWLSTTARRECLRILRPTKTGVELRDLDTVADPDGGVEQELFVAAVAAQLWAAVDALPPRRRRLLYALFRDEPRPYADISRAIGIPVGSIGPTRARALTQLRGILEESGQLRSLVEA